MTCRILHGHVLDVLATLPAESVHCCWTSVPYYGLRSYSTEPQVWGGALKCNHKFIAATSPRRSHPHGNSSLFVVENRSVTEAQHDNSDAGGFCIFCKTAWRGEHGLEPSLDLWLQHEVKIFRAVRRVLRSDGTLWVNIGDAYATSPNGRSAADQKAAGTDDRTMRDKPISTVSRVGKSGNKGNRGADFDGPHRSGNDPTFKAKDRLLMPARLAIALHADGWWLRDEIVLAKLNPMPSSVKDRTCPAHEMLYMFSKKARYYYDSQAIAEPIAEASVARYAQPTIDMQDGGAKQDHYESGFTGQRARSRRPNEIIKDLARQHKRQPAGWDQQTGIAHSTIEHNAGDRSPPTTGDNTWTSRRRRSVWSHATEPYPGAHFATAPTAWVEPCVLAGTSAKGVCSKCGAPWTRHTSTRYENPGNRTTNGPRSVENRVFAPGFEQRREARTETLGWSPSCSCPDNVPVPATVLDPFMGAGTTCIVAESLGRDSIGIELNPQYADMARARIRADLGRVKSDLPEKAADMPLFGGAR